ncbi:unnamed protein product [Brassica oleracea var. botrytis]|uniref:(rape) hypothetical protein n=1 Tax=Brassica napus TaxID=3708 RepID=A0A078H0R2_BRANA|nr:unnamed protein product [Brassica napus]CDY31366.1 BnaA02g33750D [Brassica napus]
MPMSQRAGRWWTKPQDWDLLLGLHGWLLRKEATD